MIQELNFIGHIETPYSTLDECPCNIDFSGPLCKLVLDAPYQKGLAGLQAKQNILVLYWLGCELNSEKRTVMSQSRHLGNTQKHIGTFALRSPHRPNPIGAAVLPIAQLADGALWVKGLDCLNGTKLVDIKPAILLENGGSLC